MAVGLFVKVEDPGVFTDKLAQLAVTLFQNEQVTLNVVLNTGVTLHVGNHTGGNLPTQPDLTNFVKMVSDRKHALVQSAYLSPPNGGWRINYDTQDGIVGRFEPTFGNDTARANAFLKFLEENFAVTSAKDVVSERMAHGEAAGVQMRERSVADLKEQLDKLTAFLADLAIRETEHRRKVQEELDEEHRRQRAALDEEIRTKREALDKVDADRTAALAKKAAEFEAKLAAFQTEEAKLMRRQKQAEIVTFLEQTKEFSLSGATREKRKDIENSVSWLLRVSGAVIGAVLLVIVVTLCRGQELHWFFFAPLGVSSATFVTTIVYSLKWRDRWFREHADEEIAAHRYRADILRASWVAELVSEWQDEKDDELPPQLVDAFTRSLFQGQGATRVSEHPLDALTGMMKRVESISIGGDHVEVRGKRGLKARREKKEKGEEEKSTV